MNTVVKKLLPRSWRTQAMHEKYEEERVASVISDSCPLCTVPVIAEFTYWKVVENKYPYDAVTLRHDLLIVKRHVGSDKELTQAEREELLELKETTLNDTYTFIMEALPRNKSIPGHHHLHLMIPKVVS